MSSCLLTSDSGSAAAAAAAAALLSLICNEVSPRPESRPRPGQQENIHNIISVTVNLNLQNREKIESCLWAREATTSTNLF